jgi:hypothetical protein
MCPEEMITTITEYMVINDPFDSARFVGLTNAVLNVALNGTTAAITGDRAQVPNGSGQFDRATCSLVVKAINQLPIARFQQCARHLHAADPWAELQHRYRNLSRRHRQHAQQRAATGYLWSQREHIELEVTTKIQRPLNGNLRGGNDRLLLADLGPTRALMI